MENSKLVILERWLWFLLRGDRLREVKTKLLAFWIRGRLWEVITS